jgi:hypothetical protein
MLDAVFLPRRPLLGTTRVRGLTQAASPITAAEFFVLLAAGVVAACAVALVHPEIHVQGHAILRAAVPLVLGLAIVPRRSAGSIMSVAGGLTILAFKFGYIGRLQPPAVGALLLLGPAIDLALAGSPHGWWLYLRFALAGTAANLAAFGMRFVMSWLHLDPGSGGGFRRSIPTSLVSFALCGALAGLVSGAVFFRPAPRDADSPDRAGGTS